MNHAAIYSSVKIPHQSEFNKPDTEIVKVSSDDTLKLYYKITNNLDKWVLILKRPSILNDGNKAIELSTSRYIKSATDKLFIELLDGSCFVAFNEYLIHYHATNSFFKRNLYKVSDYQGTWRIGKREAVQIARRAIKALGYPESEISCDFSPEIEKPHTTGKRVVPRYLISWESEKFRSSAEVEVNGETGAITILNVMNARWPQSNVGG